MVDFNKLKNLKAMEPKGPPTAHLSGAGTRTKRLKDLEALANLEGMVLLKPGQKFRRFVAITGKRFQHNVPND